MACVTMCHAFPASHSRLFLVSHFDTLGQTVFDCLSLSRQSSGFHYVAPAFLCVAEFILRQSLRAARACLAHHGITFARRNLVTAPVTARHGVLQRVAAVAGFGIIIIRC